MQWGQEHYITGLSLTLMALLAGQPEPRAWCLCVCVCVSPQVNLDQKIQEYLPTRVSRAGPKINHAAMQFVKVNLWRLFVTLACPFIIKWTANIFLSCPGCYSLQLLFLLPSCHEGLSQTHSLLQPATGNMCYEFLVVKSMYTWATYLAASSGCHMSNWSLVCCCTSWGLVTVLHLYP